MKTEQKQLEIQAHENRDLTRLLWQCRRGMLELDLLLIPFANEQYLKLPQEKKDAFNALLHFPDPVVFAWLMGSESPNEPELIEIVKFIRDLHIAKSF